MSALFRSDPRWLGGDAVISVPLSQERVLWLFGDSFVDLTAPFLRKEAALPRNTAAVQTGADPGSAQMTFAWRTDAGGMPSAFFPADGEAWFWPGDGIRLEEGPLVVFLHRMVATEAAPPLGFVAQGYAVALVDNPDLPLAQWRMRLLQGVSTPQGLMPGAALVREGHYVIALATRPSDHAGTFVRYRADELSKGRLSEGEWWAGKKGWVRAEALGKRGPSFVIDDAGAESSLHRDRCTKTYAHISSRGFGATDIVERRAASVTGPWSDAVPILHPPESDDPEAFVYAGRAHPDISHADVGLLSVSYVASRLSPAALLTADGQRDFYWPLFATVTRACAAERALVR